MHVAKCNFEFVEVRNPGGPNLLAAGVRPQSSLMQQSAPFAWSDGLKVDMPAEAKQIARLKLILHVMVVIEEKRIAIEDVRQQLNKPIDTPQGPLTIEGLTERPESVTFLMTPPRKLTVENQDHLVPITVEFRGDAGMPLTSVAVEEGVSVEIPLVMKPRTYAAQIVCPAEVVEAEVPMEFRDLVIDR